MSTIIGHKRQIDYLNRVLERGMLGHAYLFAGPEHVGKMTVAIELAKAMVCSDIKKFRINGSCGACFSCRMVDAGTSPDVIVLSLEQTLVSKKDKRREIPIEDIRELKRRMAFAPAGNTYRLVIIDEADKMSEEASNAFLKLLEEPGSQTLFFLISRHPDAMLPTIRSRAQTIAFSCVANAELGQSLVHRSVSEKDREDMLTIAAGRPGLLVSSVENTSFFDDERKLAKEVRNILTAADLPAALRLSERIASDTELRARAVFRLIEELRARMHAAPADMASQRARSIRYALRVSALVETVNVNPRLALDAVMLDALGV